MAPGHLCSAEYRLPKQSHGLVPDERPLPHVAEGRGGPDGGAGRRGREISSARSAHPGVTPGVSNHGRGTRWRRRERRRWGRGDGERVGSLGRERPRGAGRRGCSCEERGGAGHVLPAKPRSQQRPPMLSAPSAEAPRHRRPSQPSGRNCAVVHPAPSGQPWGGDTAAAPHAALRGPLSGPLRRP